MSLTLALTIRKVGAAVSLLATFVTLSGCDREADGPVTVSAIGAPPALRNPNLQPLDPPSALLIEATAQGLVKFDASGQIEPALAQRWIVSDDGLRYTFRLAATQWTGGGKVQAQEVVARLKAAIGPSSRNKLKPLLGAIDEIVAMTDDVLEISLKGPRPNFLQLLAQPDMAIVRNGRGSGPYQVTQSTGATVQLKRLDNSDEDARDTHIDGISLRGERSALAIARFAAAQADLVLGGTAGDLPIVRAARLSDQVVRFDPVAGLLGLVFVNRDGALANREVRDALAMAIDRTRLVADMAVPGLQPRASLVAPGTLEIAQPALPGWTTLPLQQRRDQAAQRISAASGSKPLALRVAMPASPGYRMLFARLRQDWRLIGVSASMVGVDAPADLRLVDSVAPAVMASWYLRHFTCAASVVCDAEADKALEAARVAPTRYARRESLALADALLRDAVPFIALTAPVRWSLVSDRLTGFRPSPFGRHPLGELIAPRR